MGKTFKSIRKGKEMKVTRRVALYFFSLSLIFLAVDSHLWGEQDHLAEYGVFRLNEKIDAPEFSLPDLTGRNRSLSEFQGKFIMLNFWATW
jgi:hypothetical protein